MALVDIIGKHFTSCKPTFTNLPGFLDDVFSDVIVTVSHVELHNESKIYRLHRNVLAGCSTVLHGMLVDKYLNVVHQQLDIPYMTSTEFELIIIFMYTGAICFDSVEELCFGMYAANELKLRGLNEKCAEKLIEKLNLDFTNALFILKYDKRFDNRSNNADLFQIVDETIEKNYEKILNTEVINNLDKDVMTHILCMNSTSNVREIEVFRALYRWSNTECTKNNVRRTAEQLQNIAGNLIYYVRYNLIPIKKFSKEIAPSGLLTEKFISLILQRYYNKRLRVPFHTQSRQKIEDKNKEKAKHCQLISTCTSKTHSVYELRQWKEDATLSWNADKDDSDIFFLPVEATVEAYIRWEIRFRRWSNGDFAVSIRSHSQNEEIHSSSFRLFAMVHEYPLVWVEVASVLKSGEGLGWYFFSRNLHELPNLKRIRVRVQWTDINQLPLTPHMWNYNAGYCCCNWTLKGWKNVNPTADWWSLYSTPFVRSGAIWRIIIMNSRGKNDRQLEIWIQLQHLSTLDNYAGLSMNCSLLLWDNLFDEEQAEMVVGSYCAWTAIDAVFLESRDPLDLSVIIRINGS